MAPHTASQSFAAEAAAHERFGPLALWSRGLAKHAPRGKVRAVAQAEDEAALDK